jgi:hypothetical protein
VGPIFFVSDFFKFSRKSLKGVGKVATAVIFCFITFTDGIFILPHCYDLRTILNTVISTVNIYVFYSAMRLQYIIHLSANLD